MPQANGHDTEVTALDREPATTALATGGFTRSADGTRIHYYLAGQGETALVCCDGIGCDGYAWKYIAADLAPEHQVVRWHYRAHGASEKPADRERMRISDLCDDLLAVLDELGHDQAILLGHSLGVQVILEFHRRHPHRVAGLIPVCGSYGRPIDTFHDNAALRLAFPYMKKVVDRYPAAVQKLWSAIDSELSYELALRTEVNGSLVRRQDFRPYFNHLSRMDVGLFFRLLADAAEHDTLDHLPKIDAPTLIIAGERDTFTPAWLSSVMHARIPRSELCFVPGGTHTAPIEVPELVTLRIRRFLEERLDIPACRRRAV